MKAHITRFMETVVNLAKETVVGLPVPAHQRGAGDFAEWVMLAILAQREREEATYRSVVDKLRVMDRIREVLELDCEGLPDQSTLYKAMAVIPMALVRALLQRTTTLFDIGEVAGIDGTSFNRVAASRRYARKTDYRFLAMKTTFLTDCKTGAILDIHCTTSLPHDTQIC